MKLAYIITRADAVGGASIHVRDLGRAMLEAGHEVRVFLGGDGPVIDQFSAAGVPYLSLKHLQREIHPVEDFRAFGELTRALRDFAPDLVSTHTAKAGWIGRAACRRLGIPVIYTPHGWAISDRISHVHGAIYTLAERVAARWSDAIICVSEYERGLALHRRIAPPHLLHVVHNGVRDVAPEWHARPGDGPPRIISVARFEAPKDHVTLLHALAALTSLEWELELIGDGPLESDLRSLVRCLGLCDRVRFSGYMADPAPALAQSQIFVLSSRFEGFPRSVLEAMRAGLPVIASDVGGTGEAIIEGETGYRVPAGSAAALSEAMKGLLMNGLERERLGAAGRQRYESAFRFEQMLATTNTVYATLVGQSG